MLFNSGSRFSLHGVAQRCAVENAIVKRRPYLAGISAAGDGMPTGKIWLMVRYQLVSGVAAT